MFSIFQKPAGKKKSKPKNPSSKRKRQVSKPAPAPGSDLRLNSGGDDSAANPDHVNLRELAFLRHTSVPTLRRLIAEHTDFPIGPQAPEKKTKKTRPIGRAIRATEHYVNVPRHFTEIRTPRCLMAPKCVLSAIRDDAAILADPNASDQEKLEALKFLGHWVGDAHQPMHVSFKDDRGGNRIGEQGPCSGSLHAAWDSCIVERRLGTDARAIASTLRTEITEQDRADWIESEPMHWADESYRITISPEVEYCVLEQGECRYEAGNPTWEEGEAEKRVVVDDAYLDRHLPTVRDRLKRAGVRLGHMLNNTLGQ